MTFTGVQNHRAPLRTVPLTLRVPELMLAGLAARARQFGNLPVADYAGQLLNAAYVARIGQERAEIASDRDLDAMVKLALACAGQADTAAIGKFLGMDEALVARILNGWRTAGKAGAAVKAVAPAEAAAPAKAKAAPERVGLPDSAMLLFAAIAEKCREGEADMDTKGLGAEAGLGEQTMHWARNRLEQTGMIVWTKAVGRSRPRCRLTIEGEALAREIAG